MTRLHRRRFLELGAGAAAVALGGCFGSDDEAASYAKWVPARTGGVHVGYLDFSITTEVREGDELLPLILPANATERTEHILTDMSILDSVEDPLLTWPIEVGGQLVGGAALGIAASGLGYLIDPERPDQGVDELFTADAVAIGRGTIDLDEATETLRSGSEGVFGDVPFERTGSIGDFSLYAPTSGDLDGVTALSETTVMVADTREEIQRIVETTRGDRAGALQESDVFEWLQETAGSGHIAGGWVGPIELESHFMSDPSERPAADLLRAADNVLASLTVTADDSEVTANLAAQRGSLDDETAREFDRRFGSASVEGTTTVDGNRVTASGTYTEDVLDIEFSQPDQSTPPDDADPGEPVDPPPEVAAAVPEKGFGFTYLDEGGRVEVSFPAGFDAEEVTLTAVDQDHEVSTTSAEHLRSMTVNVDPDGDTVLVTVTVDGTSGVVARWEGP
ncbi:hypothetical protein C479_03461 [Halovivax asiaticus JCM 14624]|uniref:Uncharacterized protein n=1 Tax=Halovivax asiaticus JCM 14624 TaxID=1227490 RepID=M0BS82_9EURY|nr:hypothetical protein [Halovivax asiaticus]ELZ13871.1 hypothetical protein C479_03461 [Halovivax asiaticus JCM 14624]